MQRALSVNKKTDNSGVSPVHSLASYLLLKEQSGPWFGDAIRRRAMVHVAVELLVVLEDSALTCLTTQKDCNFFTNCYH